MRIQLTGLGDGEYEVDVEPDQQVRLTGELSYTDFSSSAFGRLDTFSVESQGRRVEWRGDCSSR